LGDFFSLWSNVYFGQVFENVARNPNFWDALVNEKVLYVFGQKDGFG
jgi:hypothetical protein